MSDELISFSEARWSERCVQLAADAAKRCGNSHQHYSLLFSDQVDLEVAKLPEAMRSKAIEQAVRWDYVSATQRAILKLTQNSEDAT